MGLFTGVGTLSHPITQEELALVRESRVISPDHDQSVGWFTTASGAWARGTRDGTGVWVLAEHGLDISATYATPPAC